ncbi:hypothetical protein BYT27DRAFT_7098327 [Phlegmacium glaucopus]|nr:hypothetical protein BYT27DRAFT_7098327 [Phlegmacium glaucopus]
MTQENEDSNTIADSKPTAPKTKGPISVTVPPGKPNGGPSTPTVKKIINSGTFGAGSVKPTGSKAAATAVAAVPKAAAPPLKKPTTSAPTASSRLAMSSTSSKPAATRRASVAPAKSSASPAPKASLSASTSTKPSPDAVAAVRNSAVSPTGSIASMKGSTNTAARPRASVSDAVKKTPLAPRLSVVNPARPVAAAKTSTVSRSSAAPAVKSSKTASPISSSKEIKEDNTKERQGNEQALADLQTQLEEATESLKSKNDNVLDLESQIGKLEASLATALAEVEAKTISMEEMENAKALVEAQLQETQASLGKPQTEVLLEEAKFAANAQDTLVGKLKAQIQKLEAALSSSQDKIKALEESHAAAAASAAEAASVERERLLQAQGNLKAISEESEKLKATYKQALEVSTTQAEALAKKAAETDELKTQVGSLKSEKEDNANKLSELEIEILELKETQENLEDTRDDLQGRITTLEGDLANAAVASALAVEAASGKEAAYLAQLREQVEQHEKELATRSESHAEIVASLETLKAQHADTSKAYEQIKQDIILTEQAHASKLSELELAHAAQRDAQSAEFAKIKAELENQEAIYNSKVDIVKAEHVQLLQNAFERAKQDAGDVHAQELQSLRATSNATIEQIQAANQVALEALKADHQSALENESNALNKRISKLTIELKATQDDLSKSKAALEISRFEMESLSKQRDEARARADAGPTLSPEHADEIARLTRELANTKDDLAVVTDTLNLTKSSMLEMSDKHTRELEEGAKSRADEVIQLKSTHDSEVATLAAQKSEALVKLSDLEGELATVKATLAAQQSIVPKSSNGSTLPQQQSVTKEDLTKMHEAHNLKIYDLQAEHQKALNALREEVELAKSRAGELEQEVGRKAMEIQYLEQDQDENQEQISRLKEDVENLTEKLRQASE